VLRVALMLVLRPSKDCCQLPRSGFVQYFKCAAAHLIYLEATLAMKEQALAKTTPPKGKATRYQPGDHLLGFLNSL
jgi:hypothetical protein